MADVSSDSQDPAKQSFFIPGRLIAPQTISSIHVGVRRTPIDLSDFSEYRALKCSPKTLFLTEDADLVVSSDWEFFSLKKYARFISQPCSGGKSLCDFSLTSRGMFRALISLLLRDSVLVTRDLWENVLDDIAHWPWIRSQFPITQFMTDIERLDWETWWEPVPKEVLQRWAQSVGFDPVNGPPPHDTIPIDDVVFWWATSVTPAGSDAKKHCKDFRITRAVSMASGEGLDKHNFPDVGPDYEWRNTHIYSYVSDSFFDHLSGLETRWILLGSPQIRGAIYQKLCQTGFARGLVAPAQIREALQQITGFFEGIVLTPNAAGKFLEYPSRDDESASGNNGDTSTNVPRIPIFAKWREASATLEACADRYQVKAAKTALEWASRHDGMRTLPQWTPERLREITARLHEDLPQSGAILDWLMPQLALQTLWNDPTAFRVDPVLLIGPPGIGKSAFAEALAEVLSLGYAALSASGLQGGFELNGSSKHWGNSTPGRIFMTLARGVYATPVVVLDEIDKISGDRYHNPIPTLLDLLEPQSAAHFEDVSVGMSFDASHLIVVATANDERQIDGPLRSRFHEIQVAPPTPSERLQIVTRIAERLRAKMNGARIPDWSPMYLRRLAQSGEDVRTLRRHIQGSLAQAVLKESATIEPDEGSLPQERNRIRRIFGKTTMPLSKEDTNKVTFEDVAGVEEAKEEVKELVEFLRDPTKFQKLGGRIPRGVLMTGSPGTGKTLLAKAIAGEARVPFFPTSGSDFVEMFVGVGASRVRDVFDQAKKHAPCIIFIDEIDAVGRQRGAGLGGGHDEREQTLNQLLVEMDGFEGSECVIVIAATNRPDVLDPALLRPGRFDRQVFVPLPDIRGREQIIRIHMRKVPVSDDVVPSILARGTPGFSGADLANLVNEAALFAARANKRLVEMQDFDLAKDKIVMGAERRSIVMPEKERINTAYHESGHAVVARLLPNTDPVHKVTIIPRGRALGVTMQLPTEDRYSHDREYLLSTVAVLMAGRIAEEVFMHQMTTGAANDFERATELARNMVSRWGMSDRLGTRVYGENQSEVFLGRDVTTHKNLSDATAQLVDAEIRRIIDEQYGRARHIIETNKDKVEMMAGMLLEWETLDTDQINDIMEGRKPRPLIGTTTGGLV